ncbi:MAG: carbohydrate binding family 9 domain-containing protein, partial [Candidatus Aminicenantes bacterium]
FLFSFFVQGVETHNPGYVLQRINGVVKLDGLSDEPAWKDLQPLPMVMHIPHLGKEPTEKTELLVAYDNEFLYVAGRLYETDPAKILATSKQRDTFGPGNDWFGIIIDTFNDKENALAFFTTPTGLRLDLTVFNDARGDFPFNLSWNTFWDVKVVRGKKGWFVEMRIPFTSLRFQDKDGQVVMGLSAWRYMSHKNELVTFPKIPSDRGPWAAFMPSLTQEIVLTGVQSRKALYVTPYVLGGYSRSAELNVPGTSYEQINDPAVEAGLDIKYGFSSNLTLDITVNTDFAQVEADDQQVNLTRFSLFFPEKRLFFQERSAIFDFSLDGGNRLFYSRQIGIYDDQPVRIYGGARLVGRLGPWDLGLMSMQTAAREDQPAENFSLLRLRRRIFNPYSYIGGIVTSRLGTNGTYNIAYGLDGIFRLFGDDYLILNWAQTFENDADNQLFSLAPSLIRVNWERRNSRGFHYQSEYSRSGAEFNPGMGFLEREDYTRLGSRVGYGWFPGEKSKFFQHTVFLNALMFLSNQDQLTESAQIGTGYELITKSGYYGSFSCKYFYENVTEGFSFAEEEDDEEEPDPDPDVPVGRYTFYGLEAILATPMNKRFSLESNLYAGTFYDGWGLSMTLTPRWNISSGLELSGTYQFNGYRFPDRDKRFIAHIARLRVLNTWSIKFSTSAFIQYNSAIDAVIANIRIRYNPREGNDLYLVYNEDINTNRFREVPVIPVTNNRTLMLKYTYTFKF